MKNIFNKSNIPAFFIVITLAVVGFSLVTAGFSSANYSPVSPLAQTRPADFVNPTAAALNGVVNPNGRILSYHFDYGTTPALGQTTALSWLPASTSDISVFRNVFNLTPGTVYYFKIIAQIDANTTEGQTMSFRTPDNTPTLTPTPYPTVSTNPVAAPFIQTQLSTNVSQTSGTLNGMVSPNGALTTNWFEYGTNPNSLNFRTNSDSISGGYTSVQISRFVANLSPNTTYYFRAVGQNSYGTSYGSVIAFVTPATVIQPTPIVIIKPSPTPIVRTIVIRQPVPTAVPQVLGASTDDISCFVFVPLTSPSSPYPKQEFTFTLNYRNSCDADFSNVVLKVVMPTQVELKNTNVAYSFDAGNTLTFNLGSVYRNVQSVVIINGVVKDSANEGDTIVFGALVNFNDGAGRSRSIASYLSDSIGENGNRIGLLASLSDSFGNWVWLIVILVVLIVIVFFVLSILASKKQKEAEYNKALEAKINALR